MTLTPEKLAELREKAQAATPGNKPNPRVPTRDAGYYVRRCSDEYQVFGDDADGKLTHVASVYAKPDAAYIAAADPQTVLALVEEVERLRKENSYWMEECYHQQAKAERLSESNAKVTEARDNLLDEVGRLRAKNAAYHERLHYPCDGCPGCSSGDCPDALHIAQIDLAVWQHEAKRLRARVAELEAVMSQRMGVYAAPKDERQVGS